MNECEPGILDKNTSMSIAETLKFLPYIWKTDLVPMLLGHTGLGKTAVGMQLAKKNKWDLIVLHCAVLECQDFYGLPFLGDDGTTMNAIPNWLPHKKFSVQDHGEYREIHIRFEGKPGELAAALEELQQNYEIPKGQGWINPRGGILLLDEMNRAHEDMRQGLMQLTQFKRLHTFVLPAHYHIMSTGNPEGYEVYEMDLALSNRLAWVQFRPTFEESQEYLHKKYGSNPVLDWVNSNKQLSNSDGSVGCILDYGDEFEIPNKLYPPRMEEMHIQLFYEIQHEPEKFQRKVYDTIMQPEKSQSFITFLRNNRYINFFDILTGDFKTDKEKSKKYKDLVEKRGENLAVACTIASNLGEIFNNFEFGASVVEKTMPNGEKFIMDRSNEDDICRNVVDFIASINRDIIKATLDKISPDNAENEGNLINQDYFIEVIGPILGNEDIQGACRAATPEQQ